MYKYWIKIPTSVGHVYKTYKKNKDKFWQDAIRKEVKNVRIDFEILDRDRHVPVGWKKFTGHMVFNVKINLMRKVCSVLYGYITVDSEGSLYAGVVSR